MNGWFEPKADIDIEGRARPWVGERDSEPEHIIVMRKPLVRCETQAMRPPGGRVGRGPSVPSGQKQ